MTEEQLKTRIKELPVPDTEEHKGATLGSAQMLGPVRLEEKSAVVTLIYPSPKYPHRETLKQLVEKTLQAMPEVDEFVVNTVTKNAGSNTTRAHHAPGEFVPKEAFARLGKTVAVYSAKGGVGKSTISANLAVGLAARGYRVGLLDLDIYGPSIPRLFGLVDARAPQSEKTIHPLQAYGVHVLSISWVMKQQAKAAIWRAPIVNAVIRELVTLVEWPELDYWILDLPPGTGDIQLTVGQNFPLHGVVSVTTPQNIALDDMFRGLELFTALEHQHLGVVENMAYYMCAHCGEKSYLFPRDMLNEKLQSHGLQWLGALPFDPSISYSADEGTPFVLRGEQASEAFEAVVDRVLQVVEAHAPSK